MIRSAQDVNPHSCYSCVNADFAFVAVLPVVASEIPKECKETLVYVAGYLCKQHGLCCDDTLYEYRTYGAFQDELNRGRLAIPGDGVVHFLYFMYVSFLLLSADRSKPKPCFNVLFEAGLAINDCYDLLSDDLVEKCCRTVCNVILNNCSNSVDQLGCAETRVKLAKLAERKLP